jgi:hypothetical protein
MILLRESSGQIESDAREQEKRGWQSQPKTILFVCAVVVLCLEVWGLGNGEGTTTTQREECGR